jgi:hypothetical protein
MIKKHKKLNTQTKKLLEKTMLRSKGHNKNETKVGKQLIPK